MASIGFIGLGNMGLPMIKNLIKAGHSLKTFDLSADAQESAKSEGAENGLSVADTAKGVDTIITMVPAGPHVKVVYLGDEGIISNAQDGTLLIDCSTIDVASAREVASVAASKGFEMVDAPVSGGVGGAEAGTLTFMVGGEKAAFDKAEPILDIMGGKIVHCGGAGNGEAVKICNNMMLAISMIGVSEAFALGRKLGLEDQTLFDVMGTSSGQCWSLNSYCPVPGPVLTSPANNDYKPGFAADMMLKDIKLSQTAANDMGMETPLGKLSEELYSKLSKNGGGELDFSAIFKLLNSEI